MHYRDFLAGVHAALRPPTYLEIGVRNGDSLALAGCPSIGIDPAYKLKPEIKAGLREDVRLFRQTSDDYFARKHPLRPFDGRRVELSFIDGMHLFEFALRDFANVERLAAWTGVVVFDDIFPREVVEANRERATRAWTGDVYKILGILGEHRPDLITLRVDTEPTGLLLVLGLFPGNHVLLDRHDELVAAGVLEDPQPVPAAVLERRGALDPQAVLDASFWGVLRAARDAGVARRDGFRGLRRAVRRDFGRQVSPGPLARRLSRAG
ncbi:MAG: hypothetical protein QOI80_560 [Solirubrobacteraceae bacterium]|nr:hypothetical protein [Solirubrobacteraceae bacterium]